MNLAPFRYRRILDPSGPILKVESQPKVLIDGSSVHQVNTWLRPELAWPNKNVIYSDGAGCGTDARRVQAYYKSLSEALERWAYYSLSQGSERTRYGFDRDDSTSGMAAFPGLLPSSAKPAALREAVERWALINWWRGNLSIRPLTEFSKGANRTYSIEFSNSAVRLLVLHHEFKVGDQAHSCYGFAAHESDSKAFAQCLVEASRNREGLTSYLQSSEGAKPRSIQEFRLLHYASSAGRAEFEERVRSGGARANVLPELIVDTRVKGPWDRYAFVWRCLLPDDSSAKSDLEFMF